MYKFQFRLMTVMYCVSLAAVMAGCLTWWHRHYRTRHIREFCAAVAANPRLDSETKSLMVGLAWEPNAWESGLIQSLSGPTIQRQIVWKASPKCIRGRRTLYILDAVTRPAADAPIPLICILFDEENEMVTWGELAPYSSGFLNAKLDGQNILTVSASANWFHGKGVYKYQIDRDSIDSLGEGGFSKFDESEIGSRAETGISWHTRRIGEASSNCGTALLGKPAVASKRRHCCQCK